MQILKAIGVLDDEDTPGGSKKAKRRGGKMPEAELGLDTGVSDLPGTLGAKLDDLGKSLLNELNVIASRKADEERLSTRGSAGMGAAAGRRGGAGGVAGSMSRLAGTAGRR